MIARVARAFGQSPLAVARAPFAETAWTFAQLIDVERDEALLRESEELRAADLQACSFHEPKKLETRRLDLLARVKRGAAPARATPAAARARARAMIARMESGGVLNDLAATPPLEQ
jgi:hypothetical protein